MEVQEPTFTTYTLVKRRPTTLTLRSRRTWTWAKPRASLRPPADKTSPAPRRPDRSAPAPLPRAGCSAGCWPAAPVDRPSDVPHRRRRFKAATGRPRKRARARVTLLIDSDTQLQTCVLSTSRERPQHPAKPDCDAIIAPHADEHTHLCRCALTLAASGDQRAKSARADHSRASRDHPALTACRCASCESVQTPGSEGSRRRRPCACSLCGRPDAGRRKCWRPSPRMPAEWSQ
jgi:hypothetical protein